MFIYFNEPSLSVCTSLYWSFAVSFEFAVTEGGCVKMVIVVLGYKPHRQAGGPVCLVKPTSQGWTLFYIADKPETLSCGNCKPPSSSLVCSRAVLAKVTTV